MGQRSRFFALFLLLIMILLMLSVWIGSVGHLWSQEWLLSGVVKTFYANVSTELLGIAVSVGITVFFVDVLNQRLQEKLKKEQLIREMSSSDHGFALRAVRELNAHGWIQDGSLRSVYLLGANLQGAFLHDADLQGAYMVDANLHGAYLIKADLKGADVKGANLEDASLVGADLYKTRWLSAAKFNENTTLPDGTKWTIDTNIERFTNPRHLSFWRSDDPSSPAYRKREINDSRIPTHMGA